MKIKIKDYEYEIIEVDDDYKQFFADNGDLKLYGQTERENRLEIVNDYFNRKEGR